MLDLHSASQIVDAALAQARREGLAPMTAASESLRNELGQSEDQPILWSAASRFARPEPDGVMS